MLLLLLVKLKKHIKIFENISQFTNDIYLINIKKVSDKVTTINIFLIFNA